MKFGKNIGAQQDENGELHYVCYKGLKKKIKIVCEHLETRDLAEALSANTSFEEELSSEIKQVNDCFENLHGELLYRIGDLSEQLQQARPSTASSCAAGPMLFMPTGSSSCEVGREEFAPHFMKQLVVLLGEVDKLRRYAVWNAAAVVKILKKRRKQTNFGLLDDGVERVGWLSRQSFFSGSDFAELHVALESLGSAILVSQIQGSGMSDSGQIPVPSQQAVGHCPICLDPLVDTVELECKHRFCWKCFVLGPIASQPGQYRITSCPVCRRQTSLESSGTGQDDTREDSAMVGTRSALSRFLRTYFKDEWDQIDKDGAKASRMPDDQLSLDDDEDGFNLKNVIGDLMKVVQTDSGWSQPRKARDGAIENSSGPGGAAAATDSAAAGLPGGDPSSASSDLGKDSKSVPRDFLQTLPTPQPKDEQQMRAAQKMQWLQIASVGDPLAFCGEMNCLLCSEPLHTEEFLTTPCKHHFHRVCIQRLDMPSCPLCGTNLPFSWFLPAGHPLAEEGFNVIEEQKYRPICPGGPSRGSGGYPLHRPPPIHLHGKDGMQMRSYLHRIPPMGEDAEEIESPRKAPLVLTPNPTPKRASHFDGEEYEELQSAGSRAVLSSGSASGSSSEDSGTEDEDSGLVAEEDRHPIQWAYHTAGKMRLLSGRCRLRYSSSLSSSKPAAITVQPMAHPCATAAAYGPILSDSAAEASDFDVRPGRATSSGSIGARLPPPVVLCIGDHI